MAKRLLFIDRDGTIIQEPPVDYQVDRLEKFKFVDGAIVSLYNIRRYTDFEFVMATNQDGLGTSSFPEEDFWPYQNLMLDTLKSAGVEFSDILIDRSFESDPTPSRKPGTGMMTKYISNPEYDLSQSLVVGDRATDVELAKNLGCRAVFLGKELPEALEPYCALKAGSWTEAERFIISNNNIVEVVRNTAETKITLKLYPANPEIKHIDTGVKFFDHMLSQLPVHGCFGLDLVCKGDIEVDEHHTIEDTAIALGECILQALSDKRGIERYGYCLPMDDCLCQVCLDFGGRPWLVWDADFKREKIGEMPTEMFLHFFKSLSDAAKMNLNIKAEGQNEHHKIEGIFKALARALKMAVRRDIYHYELPSTKGML